MNILITTKQNYYSVLQHINALIDTYREIELCLKCNNNNINNISTNNTNILLTLETERKNTESIINEIEEKIYNLCDHNFIVDYIDVYPCEMMKKITYCSICESMKK